jgi:hypothetical protein
MQIALAVALAALVAPQTPSEDLGPAKELRILYAGALGTERAARFIEFLTPWFAKVDGIALGELTSKAAAPYDVVIADWKRLYGPDGFTNGDMPRGTLEAGFDRPIVMIGAVAGSIQRESQLDWL